MWPFPSMSNHLVDLLIRQLLTRGHDLTKLFGGNEPEKGKPKVLKTPLKFTYRILHLFQVNLKCSKCIDSKVVPSHSKSEWLCLTKFNSAKSANKWRFANCNALPFDWKIQLDGFDYTILSLFFLLMHNVNSFKFIKNLTTQSGVKSC